MPKIFHRNATSCSAAGVVYEKGKDGAFEVPAEAFADLAAHGFVSDPKDLEVKTPAPAADPGLAKKLEEAEELAEQAMSDLAKVTAERDTLAQRLEALQQQKKPR